MPSVPLAIKSIPVNSVANKCLVIPPRSSMQLPLKYDDPTVQFGTWSEVRVGMLFDFEGANGGEVVTEPSTYTSGLSQAFYFGLKNSNTTNYPSQDLNTANGTSAALSNTGPYFAGISEDPNLFNYGNSFGGINSNLGGGQRGISGIYDRVQYGIAAYRGPGAGILYSDYPTGPSNAGSSLGLDNWNAGNAITAPNTIIKLMFRLRINGSSNLLIDGPGTNYNLASQGHTGGPTMTTLLGLLDSSFPANGNIATMLQGNVSNIATIMRDPTASCIFINNPFLLNAMRIHAVAIKKYA